MSKNYILKQFFKKKKIENSNIYIFFSIKKEQFLKERNGEILKCKKRGKKKRKKNRVWLYRPGC